MTIISSAAIISPARSVSAATPGVGSPNSVLKSCSSLATAAASAASARRIVICELGLIGASHD